MTQYIESLIKEWGLATILYLLEIYEKDEDYELCACIVEAIKHFEAKVNAKNRYTHTKLPTRLNQHVMEIAVGEDALPPVDLKARAKEVDKLIFIYSKLN